MQDVKAKSQLNKQCYKQVVDAKCKNISFNVGVPIMIKLRQQMQHQRVHKLNPKKIGSFPITKVINNVYIVELPSKFNISNPFDVPNIASYYPSYMNNI